jgi:hypothetical protein
MELQGLEENEEDEEGDLVAYLQATGSTLALAQKLGLRQLPTC